MKYGLLVFMLIITVPPLLAQTMPVELYEATVITNTGRRVRGILDNVTQTHVNLVDDYDAAWYGKITIPFSEVKKVVIRRKRKRGAAITGAIVGAAVTDYFVVQSAKKNPFSSPVSYGISLLFAAGAGAGLGAIIGQKVGSSSRRVIRPTGQNSEAAYENLRRQLLPFTYSNQNDLLNGVRP